MSHSLLEPVLVAPIAEMHAGLCFIMNTAFSSKLISNDCDAFLSIQTK